VLGGFAVLALIALIVALSNSGSSPSGTTTAGTVAPSTSPATTSTTPAATTSSTTTTPTPTPMPADPDSGNLDGDVITEEWFVGVWSDTRGCEESYRFDPGGIVIAPDGSRGIWSIEDGNVLVVSGSGGTERSAMTRVSDDEVMGSDGPGYRCPDSGRL